MKRKKKKKYHKYLKVADNLEKFNSWLQKIVSFPRWNFLFFLSGRFSNSHQALEEYRNTEEWKVASPPRRGCLWLFDSRLNDLDERALQLIRQNGYFTLVSMHELRQPIEHPFLD